MEHLKEKIKTKETALKKEKIPLFLVIQCITKNRKSRSEADRL